MCPGGKVVVASSQAGGVVTNGMSYHDRASGTANSALLCDVRTSDFGSEDVLAGVAFQEKLEHQAFLAGGSSYAPPRCTWGELRDGKAPQVACRILQSLRCGRQCRIWAASCMALMTRMP